MKPSLTNGLNTALSIVYKSTKPVRDGAVGRVHSSHNVILYYMEKLSLLHTMALTTKARVLPGEREVAVLEYRYYLLAGVGSRARS